MLLPVYPRPPSIVEAAGGHSNLTTADFRCSYALSWIAANWQCHHYLAPQPCASQPCASIQAHVQINALVRHRSLDRWQEQCDGLQHGFFFHLLCSNRGSGALRRCGVELMLQLVIQLRWCFADLRQLESWQHQGPWQGLERGSTGCRSPIHCISIATNFELSTLTTDYFPNTTREPR